MPELVSIQIGYDAFCFRNNDDSTQLVLRSGDGDGRLAVDMPKLVSLETQSENSWTFNAPHHVILESE